jgi:crotonobetainyl-CoA:carnitine CoA-transferase CaiB-like acyl-CoA transferase
VAELSDDVGAATCGRLLAEYGAAVTRLVRSDAPPRTALEGHPRPEGGSLRDLVLDRKKRVVHIDGLSPATADQWASLTREVDIFISDASTAVLDELGLSAEAMRERDPSLIYCRISPYGETGPLRNWSGGELEVQALCGLSSQLGSPGESPLHIPYGWALAQTGVHAAGAIVFAALARHATSAGAVLDIAALDVMAASIRMYSLLPRYYGIPLKRSGRRAPGSLGRYPTAIFPCKDGYVVMTARSGEQWRSIVAMMGDPPWAREPRFNDSYGMAVEYPDDVDAQVVPWALQYSRAELLRLGVEFKVPMGPVREVHELLDEEQFAFRGFLQPSRLDTTDCLLPGRPTVISEDSEL